MRLTRLIWSFAEKAVSRQHIVREIVTILRRGTNTIKRNRHTHVEDEPEDMVLDNTDGGNIGSSPTRYDDSWLRHRLRSESISAVGRSSADLSSTLADPFGYDGQHRPEERPSNRLIAMQITDEEDSTMQQDQAILGMHGQEQATEDVDQRQGVLDESHTAGSVGIQKSSDNHIGHLARERKATNIPSHCDGADTEQSDIPPNSTNSPSEDEEQSGEPPQGLHPLSRERKSPTRDSGSDSMNDTNIRPVQKAALQAQEALSRQTMSHTPEKRRKQNKDAAKGMEVLVEFEPQFGNDAAFTALRSAKDTWTLFFETDFAMVGLSEATSPDASDQHKPEAVFYMISLGRWICVDPARSWTYTVFRRIQNVHLHRLYANTVRDKTSVDSFFEQSDVILRLHGMTPTRQYGQGHRSTSIVKDRLVDLILLDRRIELSRERCRQAITDADQVGKRWNPLCQGLGYEVFLLAPPEFSDRKLKALTDGQIGRLVNAWQARFAQLSPANIKEVKQMLELRLMPSIKPYVDIYGTEGKLTSVSTIEGRGLDELAQEMPDIETQEAFIQLPDIASTPRLRVNNQGLSDNDDSQRKDVAWSEWIEGKLLTTPLRSLVGAFRLAGST